MKTHEPTDLACRLSLIVGPLSGPFVFKAAGLQDFPSLQFSHVMVMMCYVFGALTLSQLGLRYVLRTFLKIRAPMDLAYWLSLIVGPLSGPFVFRAAGLQDFPSLQFSHVLIMICYVFGALTLSQLGLRCVLETFGGGKTGAAPLPES